MLPRLEHFLRFLTEKNQQLNLISRKLSPETILIEHLYDCLSGFSYFQSESYQTITDLGSGGGFPGLLLGIQFPEKRIDLVEKSPKKANYLREATKELGLKNVTVYPIVAEDYSKRSDLFTCRGFKPAEEILTMTESYFQKGVGYLLFKGRMESIQEELVAVEKRFPVETSVTKIAEKIEGKERHLVMMRKRR